MKAAALIFIFCFITSCGVKAPPVAPERTDYAEPNLNCSPYDEDCDLTDPNYKPAKK